MRTEELHYDLPTELIAQQPAPVRSDSRLLVLIRQRRELIDSKFSEISEFLHPGDCLVLNDTKVLPARFFAQRKTGGKLEGLFLKEEPVPGTWQVMLKGARKVKLGEKFHIKNHHDSDFCSAEVIRKKDDGSCCLSVNVQADTKTILNQVGFPPLPPYIKRDENLEIAKVDRLRYQTVYAKKPGAVAAPTAGLHFTNELIEQLKQRKIKFAYLTLHVAAGTFKPIKTDNIEDHKIHQEEFYIDEENARIINQAKNKGGRIISVGTTSTRVLETVAVPTTFEVITPPGTKNRRCRTSNWTIPFYGKDGKTKLFIKPGYKFKIVDAMITNFHLPKSTLLALVAAFAGLENILTAYRHATEKQYRFYSYGYAMLII
jgi:S-adenosylmethionine:tRNA ribosyltransferase-isomerase